MRQVTPRSDAGNPDGAGHDDNPLGTTDSKTGTKTDSKTDSSKTDAAKGQAKGKGKGKGGGSGGGGGSSGTSSPGDGGTLRARHTTPHHAC